MKTLDLVRLDKTMSRHQPLTFALPQGWQRDDVVLALQAAYALKREKRVTADATYYDTFDWRLFNKSLTLVCTPHQARLLSLRDERTVCQADITAPPLLRHDIPPGELHNRLSPLLGVRALLPLFELTSHYQPLQILNDEAKTVVRLTVEQHRLKQARGTPPLVTRVCLHPLKGYAKEAQKLRQWLVQQAFTPCSDSLYARALSAVAKRPNDYVAKPCLQLRPTLRADDATKQILRFLLSVIRRNEAGIINDLDPEFLHDFRVASRRTRSALGQLKAVFPAPVTKRFKADFAWLGSITNRVRDLDVYLLQQEAYKAKLAAPYRDAIDPLFAMLRQERARAHTALVRQLRTKKYQDRLDQWEAFLATPCDAVSDAAPAAARPILQVARKRIKKKARSIVTLGTALRHSDDRQGLHMLRLECKKLRYLFEFFESLLPAQKVAPVVKQLRKLQDNLGDFHDLCVQQADLQTFAARMATSQHHRADTLLAIGGLIEILEAEKATVRQAFPQLFTAFVNAYREVTL